jgi:hypothetical protein
MSSKLKYHSVNSWSLAYHQTRRKCSLIDSLFFRSTLAGYFSVLCFNYDTCESNTDKVGSINITLRIFAENFSHLTTTSMTLDDSDKVLILTWHLSSLCVMVWDACEICSILFWTQIWRKSNIKFDSSLVGSFSPIDWWMCNELVMY